MWSNNRSQHPHPFVMHACIIDTACVRASPSSSNSSSDSLPAGLYAFLALLGVAFLAAAFLVVLLGLGVAFLAEGLGVAFLADDLGVAFLALAGFLVADFFTCRRKHGSRTRAQGTAAGAGVSVHVHKCRWVASYSGTSAKAVTEEASLAEWSARHSRWGLLLSLSEQQC